MTEKKYYERRLRRLHGMTPDQLKAMHEASGSTMWWARCWNCKRSVEFRRDTLDHTDCPYCGVNLSHRGSTHG